MDDNCNGMDPFLAAMLVGNRISNEQAYYNQQAMNQRQADIFYSFCPPENVLIHKTAARMLLGDIDGAQKFLDEAFVREAIFQARNQRPSCLSMDQILDKIREKYQRFYQKIGRTMPERFLALRAEELCRVAEVREMKPLTKEEYEKQLQNAQAEQKKKRKNIWVIILVILAVILIIIALACALSF